jgi:hypothetical protein
MRDALDHLAAHPELAETITGTVPLEGVGPSIEALRAGQGGIKVLVDPGQ